MLLQSLIQCIADQYDATSTMAESFIFYLHKPEKIYLHINCLCSFSSSILLLIYLVERQCIAMMAFQTISSQCSCPMSICKQILSKKQFLMQCIADLYVIFDSPLFMGAFL